MAVLVIPGNTTAHSAAFSAADLMADVTMVAPDYYDLEMWGAGLTRTDREGSYDGENHIRWGWMFEFARLASVAAGFPKPTITQNLYPDTNTVIKIFKDKLAFYSDRQEKDIKDPSDPTKTIKAHGKITYLKEHELSEVIRSNVYPFPITSCKFIDASSASRNVVEISFSNVADCGDELDIARRVCLTRVGRESEATSGDSVAGVQIPSVSRAVCYDEFGERLPTLDPAPYQKVGRADRRTMAFSMRVPVTKDDLGINWADVDLGPNYNPRDYDTDLKIAIAYNLKEIPGSINEATPGRPGQAILEWDMNNGGGTKIGMSWIGRWLNWMRSSWKDRKDYRDVYVLNRLGLFKTICSDPAWVAALPEMVADTKRWKLIPDFYPYPKWAAAQDVGLGTRKFKSPYIYEVVSVTDDDGIVYTTKAPPAWVKSTVYRVGDQRSNGLYRYQVISVPVPPVTTPPTPATGTSASSGGPTGKGTSIEDGTVTWKYIGLVTPIGVTGPTGPSGVGEAIADGTRVVWRMHRFRAPGMPWSLYIRETPRINGRNEQTMAASLLPFKTPKDPVTAYGYPHFDVHSAAKFANDDGFIAFEGELSNVGDACTAQLSFDSMRPAYGECCNLIVGRGVSGTRMGWVTCRIEMPYIKFGEVAGIALGVADRKGVYIGDLDYANDMLPVLRARGALIDIPKAA